MHEIDVVQITLKHLKQNVQVHWNVNGEQKSQAGFIHMVGPNYLGLAVPYPKTSIGGPTHHYLSIPRNSITRITLLEKQHESL